jgi:3-oxoadipate enol-lactonase
MPTAPTNGVTTYYEDQDSGPPVVLIHGHSVDLRMWDPQVDALTTTGYRFIRYDTRGHGRSDAPDTGYTPEDYSADLRDLLEGLAVDRAHLVGLSMGGSIAMQSALDEPQRVGSLTLIDSALPGFGYSPEFESAIQELQEAVRREGPRPAFERLWLPHPLFDGLRRFPDRFAALREMVLSFPAKDYLLEAEPPPERQLVDRLGEVSAPTLVMVGELDLPDFQIIAEVLAANIPGARRAVIADAGHVCTMERPEAVNEALLAFLNDVR